MVFSNFAGSQPGADSGAVTTLSLADVRAPGAGWAGDPATEVDTGVSGAEEVPEEVGADTS